MNDNTIYEESKVGKRLKKIKKSEVMQLVYQGKYLPVISEIRIGRERGNHIIIDDTLTSRNHAKIQKIKDAYFITDLGSTNGTFVNNKQVPSGKYVKLKPNDTIRVGRTDLYIKL